MGPDHSVPTSVYLNVEGYPPLTIEGVYKQHFLALRHICKCVIYHRFSVPSCVLHASMVFILSY